MIECNIELHEYKTNGVGIEEFEYAHLIHIIKFPVLPSVGTIISITKCIEKKYEVLEINYRATINDHHDYDENLPEMLIYIIVKEVK